MSRARVILEIESPRSVIKRLPRLLQPGDYFLALGRPPLDLNGKDTEFVPLIADEQGQVSPADGEYGLLADVEDALGFTEELQRWPDTHPELLTLTDEQEEIIADEMHKYLEHVYKGIGKGKLKGTTDGVAGPREWQVVRWPRGTEKPEVVEALSPRDLLKKHFHLTDVQVVGRRWWRRSYGGTYNTADIYVNGELVHTLPMAGGYGDHYLTRAFDWLRQKGYLPKDTDREAPWRLAEKFGFKLLYSAYDVKRQRDL